MKIAITEIPCIVISVMAKLSLRSATSRQSAKVILAKAKSSVSVVSIPHGQICAGGVVLYGIGAVVWLNQLSKGDVSKAYSSVSLDFLLTAVLSYLTSEVIARAACERRDLKSGVT